SCFNKDRNNFMTYLLSKKRKLRKRKLLKIFWRRNLT
ncbi:hypothetical protein CP8484711_0710B, partial [Chlamydia psittaci 84-8471/1]